jgi:SulP family sulfate permease
MLQKIFPAFDWLRHYKRSDLRGDLSAGFVEQKRELRWVIMDLSGVNDVDGVGIDALEEIMEMYRLRGIEFLFAAMKGPVRDLVAKAGWEEKYGKRIAFNTPQAAIKKMGIEA